MAKKRRPPKRATRKRPAMTPAEVRAYFARWKRMNEFIAAERRAMTPQQRFDELVRLLRWPAQFGLRDIPEPDNRAIWERWNKLREALRG
jgi:hypothetical protein